MKFKKSLFYLLLSSCCVINTTDGMHRQKQPVYRSNILSSRLNNIRSNLHEKRVVILGAHPMQKRHADRYENLSQKCEQLTYVDVGVPYSDFDSAGFSKTAYTIANWELVKYEPVGEISLKFFMILGRAEGGIVDSTDQPMIVEFTKNNITVVQGDFNSYLVQEYFKQSLLRKFDLAIFDYYVATIPNNVQLPLIRFIWEHMLSRTGVIAIDHAPRDSTPFTECINEPYQKFINLFIPPLEEVNRCILLGMVE